LNQSRAFLTSLVFAGVAMLLVFFYISDKESSIKAEFGTDVTVVVATRDINEFEQFQSGMISTIIVPKKFAQPGSLSDPSIFLTSGSVAAAPIRKGEQILLTKVLLRGAETGLATQVGISKRALSIPVSDVTGVTKLIKPGDRIDIISNIGYQGPTGQVSEVKTLLQDIQVLAVGEVIQNQIPSVFEEDPLTSSKRAVNLRGSRAFNTVTVEVAPLEAQTLIFVIQNSSELFLTLRNPVDRILADIPTTTVDEVLGSNSKKARGNKPSLAFSELGPVPARAPSSTPAVPPPQPNPFSQAGGGPIVK
jgi:pilus assembly protein CpaB